MSQTFQVPLDASDLGQLLDGLEIRAVVWEKTAEYRRTGKSPIDFMVEECTGADEAERFVNHYRSIVRKIQKQREEQI